VEGEKVGGHWLPAWLGRIFLAGVKWLLAVAGRGKFTKPSSTISPSLLSLVWHVEMGPASTTRERKTALNLRLLKRGPCKPALLVLRRAVVNSRILWCG
jgi:hypothetical protein